LGLVPNIRLTQCFADKCRCVSLHKLELIFRRQDFPLANQDRRKNFAANCWEREDVVSTRIVEIPNVFGMDF